MIMIMTIMMMMMMTMMMFTVMTIMKSKWEECGKKSCCIIRNSQRADARQRVDNRGSHKYEFQMHKYENHKATNMKLSCKQIWNSNMCIILVRTNMFKHTHINLKDTNMKISKTQIWNFQTKIYETLNVNACIILDHINMNFQRTYIWKQ